MANATARPLVLFLSLACLSLSNPAREPGPADSSFTVHEWGTFTSVADRTGRAIKWKALDGSPDLPTFVKHFYGANFKAGLRGTIRMETPVLYFYSPTETTVSVKVRFSRGVISEWYPAASRVDPDAGKFLDPDTLFTRDRDGSITWDSVTVQPGLTPSFAHDDVQTHYYTARETSATPLSIKTGAGSEQEKFLFYRGVSVFPIPIAAKSLDDGTVHVSNLLDDEIPSVILFERHGEKLGYRVLGALQKEAKIESPDLTSNLDSLSQDLEATLVAEGLYADEAHAMVKTWRDSWFEEGSRLLYIVPRRFLDTVLPLSIHPAPSQTTRVFVGRLELLTPATEKAFEAALAAHDLGAISRFGRFLIPIMDQIKAENPARAAEFDKQLQDSYNHSQPRQ